MFGNDSISNEFVFLVDGHSIVASRSSLPRHLLLSERFARQSAPAAHLDRHLAMESHALPQDQLSPGRDDLESYVSSNPRKNVLISTFDLEMTFLYSWWSNSDVQVFADRKEIEALQGEHAMILVNHRYEIDWLLGLVVSQQLGLLGVSSTFFVTFPTSRLSSSGNENRRQTFAEFHSDSRLVVGADRIDLSATRLGTRPEDSRTGHSDVDRRLSGELFLFGAPRNEKRSP